MSSNTDWKHVGLKVEQSQYDEWEDYLEESDYGSMSNLIRTAVEGKREQDASVGATVAQGEGATGVTDEHVAELVDTVNAMQGRMERLENSVTEATDAMYTGGTSVGEDVTTDIYQVLPEGPEEARSTFWIAEEVGRDETTVRVALEQLQRTTDVVSKITQDKIIEGEDGRTLAGEKLEEPNWFKRV